MSDDAPESDTGALVNASGSIKISDVFGIGAAANSKAAQEIVRCIFGTFMDPLKV